MDARTFAAEPVLYGIKYTLVAPCRVRVAGQNLQLAVDEQLQDLVAAAGRGKVSI